jgi:hypothetical protein
MPDTLPRRRRTPSSWVSARIVPFQRSRLRSPPAEASDADRYLTTSGCRLSIASVAVRSGSLRNNRNPTNHRGGITEADWTCGWAGLAERELRTPMPSCSQRKSERAIVQPSFLLSAVPLTYRCDGQVFYVRRGTFLARAPRGCRHRLALVGCLFSVACRPAVRRHGPVTDQRGAHPQIVLVLGRQMPDCPDPQAPAAAFPGCGAWCDHPGPRLREHEGAGRPICTMSYELGC